MERVFVMIAETATMLGLDLKGNEVTSARAIARLAIEDGRTEDEAYEFARGALLGESLAA